MMEDKVNQDLRLRDQLRKRRTDIGPHAMQPPQANIREQLQSRQPQQVEPQEAIARGQTTMPTLTEDEGVSIMSMEQQLEAMKDKMRQYEMQWGLTPDQGNQQMLINENDRSMDRKSKMSQNI